MIEFRDVEVCYAPEDRHAILALEGLNLHIARGEWVFLVGPSGAGKSTVLKLLYGGAQVTKGEVLIEERDITKLTTREIPLLRRRIGVIFQDFLLMPQKTVWENVAFALQVIGAPQKTLVRQVPKALETVGLHHKANAKPNQLSGGEQQRVAIARAIVNQPSLVLADEPTGNLDPQTGNDIIEVLQRINAQGTTILMATHDRAVVDKMRRRVVRLADGRAVSDEQHGQYHIEDGVLHQPHSPAHLQVLADVPAPPKREKQVQVLADVAVSPKSPPQNAPQVFADDVVAKNVVPRREEPGNASSTSTSDDSPGAPLDPRRERPLRQTTPTIIMPPQSDAAAREIAPVKSTLQRPANSEKADENSPFSEPKSNGAPLGSPENPLVQFDRNGNSLSRRND